MKSFSKAVFVLLASSHASADNVWERMWRFSESSELSRGAVYEEEPADTTQLADGASVSDGEEAEAIARVERGGKKGKDKRARLKLGYTKSGKSDEDDNKDDKDDNGSKSGKSGDDKDDKDDKSSKSGKSEEDSGDDKDKTESSKSGKSESEDKSKDKSESASTSTKSSKSSSKDESSSKDDDDDDDVDDDDNNNDDNNRSGKCIDDEEPSATRDADTYKFKLKKKNARCVDKDGNAYEFGEFDDIRNFSDCADACVKDVHKDVLDGFEGFDFDCKNERCLCLYDEGTLDDGSSDRYDRVNKDKDGKGKIKGTKDVDDYYCGKLKKVKSVFADDVGERGALRGYI